MLISIMSLLAGLGIEGPHIDTPISVIEDMHLNFPIWLVIVLIPIACAVIGYIWHRWDNWAKEITKQVGVDHEKFVETLKQVVMNTDRLGEIERKGDETLEKGKPLTVEEHGKICSGVARQLVDELRAVMKDSIASRDKWLEARLDAIDEKIENKVIKLIMQRREDREVARSIATKRKKKV